jgi:hypothetical protein
MQQKQNKVLCDGNIAAQIKNVMRLCRLTVTSKQKGLNSYSVYEEV